MATSIPPLELTKFPTLPAEMQLKIFRTASNTTPRVIDIWTDWKKLTEGHTVFYAQYYTTELSPLTPPPVMLSVNAASRSECLKSNSWEFAAMWINLQNDTLVPRGFWNMVSFEDFAFRIEGRMRCIAIDVSAGFWRDNLRDYCRKKCWILNGVQEVLLYDGSAEGAFKGGEDLDRFRRKAIGRRELKFEEMDGGARRGNGEKEANPDHLEAQGIGEEELGKLRDVEKFLGRVFDLIDGSGTLVGGEDGVDEFGFVRKADFVTMIPTKKKEFKRPVVKLMKLSMSAPRNGA